MSTCDSTKSLVPCSQDSLQVPFQNELKLRNLDLGHCAAENNLTNASVSIENSSEVVIGPVTHYHIHIPEDATQRKNETEVEDTGKKEEQKTETKLAQSESSSSEHEARIQKPLFPFKYFIVILLGLLLICVLSGILLSVKLIQTTKSYEELALDRNSWGGLPAVKTTALKHPVGIIVIKHTVTSFCKSQEQCSQTVKSIQKSHLSKNFDDIAYNFLIGGDGLIYVGRGWNHTNSQSSRTIDISFIGNFQQDELQDQMKEALDALLEYGQASSFLTEDYIIVAHSQISQTLSPGSNILRVMKDWNRYKSGHFSL